MNNIPIVILLGAIALVVGGALLLLAGGCVWWFICRVGRHLQWKACCQYQNRVINRDTWTQQVQGRTCRKCGTFHPCNRHQLIHDVPDD